MPFAHAAIPTASNITKISRKQILPVIRLSCSTLSLFKFAFTHKQLLNIAAHRTDNHSHLFSSGQPISKKYSNGKTLGSIRHSESFPE